MSMQRCVFCQTELPDSARFCRACGRMQPADVPATPPAAASGALTRLCPNCGEALPQIARFCANCGRSLSSEISLAPLAPGIGAPEQRPGAPDVPVAPAWSQSGGVNVPHVPAGPQSGSVSVPGAPAGPQSGAWVVPHVPAGVQSGFVSVPGAPAAAQGGVPNVPGAPAWPQGGAPNVPGAPAAAQGGAPGVPPAPGSPLSAPTRAAGRSAGKVAGRSLGSKLLGTAAGKVIGAVIAVMVVATGGTTAAVAIGHNPIATAFQQITGHGANNTPPPPPPEVTYIGSDGNIWDATLPQGKPRQLTTDAAAGDPNTGAGSITYSGLAWSPDGSMLAVIRITYTDSYGYEILMLSPGGSLLWKQSLPQSPLTNSLAWSPDGRFIAYSQATQNYGYGPGGYDLEGELVIVNTKTGSTTNTLNYDAGPTGSCGGGTDAMTGLIWAAHNAHMGINTFDWSPDGQKILIAFNDADSESALVALSNGVTTSGYPEGASFQPNGHLILGTSYGQDGLSLELADATGKQVRMLAQDSLHGDSPYENNLGQATWSSDGKTIYYEYQDSIWRINVDGSGAKQIIAGTQIVNNQVTVELAPRLSPDGKWLLYLNAQGVIDDTGYSAGSATGKWYVVQVDGSGAHALPQGTIGAQQYIYEAIWRPVQ